MVRLVHNQDSVLMDNYLEPHPLILIECSELSQLVSMEPHPEHTCTLKLLNRQNNIENDLSSEQKTVC